VITDSYAFLGVTGDPKGMNQGDLPGDLPSVLPLSQNGQSAFPVDLQVPHGANFWTGKIRACFVMGLMEWT
jgi:hypothetical protein